MLNIRISYFLSSLLFILMLGILLAFREDLLEIHSTEVIEYFASDAGTYFNAYQTIFSDVDLTEAPELLLVGSPILFMNIVGGNLILIQFCQLVLMFISVKIGIDCFESMRGRIAFIFGSLIFPYFLFGFLSLNKEIYAMCATIFYCSYYLRGKRSHLLVALCLAMVSRYYMLISLVTLFYLIPRSENPRYWLIVALLVFISLAAPLAKSIIPGYSSEGLLDAPSIIGGVSSNIIDNFGYWIFYPIKYLMLIPMRAYGFFVDPTRNANVMEGFVSIFSLLVVVISLYLVLFKKRTHPTVKKFILVGFIAPMPIMWSEIMHWRYYSFVYFFFIFAIILHYIDRCKHDLTQQIGANYA